MYYTAHLAIYLLIASTVNSILFYLLWKLTAPKPKPRKLPQPNPELDYLLEPELELNSTNKQSKTNQYATS